MDAVYCFPLSLQIGVAILIVAFVIFATAVGVLLVMRCWQRRCARGEDKTRSLSRKATSSSAAWIWHVDRGRIIFTAYERIQGHSVTSEQLNNVNMTASTTSTVDSLGSDAKNARKYGLYQKNLVKIRCWRQIRFIELEEDDLKFLTNMKQLIHDNLNPFIGMSINQHSELLVLWKYCSYGTLHDLLQNKEMELNTNFKHAFKRDISKGLDYLHSSTVGFHGCLSTLTCVVDSHWVVKLRDYAIVDKAWDWTCQGFIDASILVPLNEVFYMAPEKRRLILGKKDANNTGNINDAFLTTRTTLSMDDRRRADMFSYGMCFYEIFFRTAPFCLDEVANREHVLTRLQQGDLLRPQLPEEAGAAIKPELIALMKQCWSENPLHRPTIKEARRICDAVTISKGSLVDQMMKRLEDYAANLEKIVQERTSELEDMRNRAERLLLQLLPKFVAKELEMGRPVPPKMFSSATVMFTDIVEFTTLCSLLTPLEVVTMLNEIFSHYDIIIASKDAYKVETIGDAYLVVSGVPNENGSEHAGICAEIAIRMQKYLSGFHLPFGDRRRIQARWGVHTGMIAAGVVGMTAPRYCLFGDTVNVASRMESTSLPERIQVSSEAFCALESATTPFTLEPRGEVLIKGKGLCTTYWLTGMETSAED